MVTKYSFILAYLTLYLENCYISKKIKKTHYVKFGIFGPALVMYDFSSSRETHVYLHGSCPSTSMITQNTYVRK